MEKLYNIKTYLDKLLLLEASYGDRKWLVANLWGIGMFDMKFGMDMANYQEDYALVFNLRHYHPLAKLFNHKLQDTYILRVPHVYGIGMDEKGRISVKNI